MGLNGFYAGSFDPFTIGHLAIIEKSCKTFDKVLIGIGINSGKERRTDEYSMKNAIEETLKLRGINNAETVVYTGLTADCAIENSCQCLIRGIRNGTDYQYEENIASVNEQHFGLDTCYFRAGKYGHISSSMVMELFKYNKDITHLVPEPVQKVLEKN